MKINPRFGGVFLKEIMPKKIQYRNADVTLKRVIWNGSRKVPKGTEFVDEECYEGKYQPDHADVVFHDEKEPDPTEEPMGINLSKILE